MPDGPPKVEMETQDGDIIGSCSEPSRKPIKSHNMPSDLRQPQTFSAGLETAGSQEQINPKSLKRFAETPNAAETTQTAHANAVNTDMLSTINRNHMDIEGHGFQEVLLKEIHSLSLQGPVSYEGNLKTFALESKCDDYGDI